MHIPNFKSISQKTAEKSLENRSVTDRQTDRRTDGRKDRQTASKLRVPRQAGRGLISARLTLYVRVDTLKLKN